MLSARHRVGSFLFARAMGISLLVRFAHCALKPFGFNTSDTGKLPFSRPLSRFKFARAMGFEPTTFPVTGGHSNQAELRPHLSEI
ncbi:MAG: hypothetical protein UX23_C0012G0029 [Parcubacteria group bacterium GW2011_GWB1_45_9]|nr:MAG: hypothetical protein UX23_C0012G0029 [Parcubacteria group bacterium GW2011_GWB1_45_9]